MSSGFSNESCPSIPLITCFARFQMDKTLVDSLFTQTQLNASIVSIVSQTFQSFLDQKLVLDL